MEQFWESLQNLISATNETNLENSLNIALNAGEALSGAEILAIYLANDQDPGLQRYGSIGADRLLPDQLPAQDLIHLRKPQLWSPGKRSNTILHNAARKARFPYLASAPMGQPNAIIGLIVITDTQGSSTEYTLQIVKLLANTITTIIQGHFRGKQIQNNLDSNNQRLRVYTTLEEQIHEGLLLLDPDMKISRMNLSAEMMLGYSNQEVVDQPVDKIIIGTESLIPALRDAQRGSANFYLGDQRLFRRNGETFLAHVRTFPIKNKNIIEGILILITDLSEQEQIQEHTQKLEQQAFLGEITAIFAHEVRNPINNISTGLQLMALNLPEDSPDQTSIDRIQQDCDRLEELMKSVLTFSRTTEYEMDLVDLPFLINRLIERSKQRISHLDIEYNLQIESGCPPVHGNTRALEQVFTNLINNSIQAMRETGGKLALKIQTVENPGGDRFVETSVADTGPGIAKELQDRIFEPYFTTERSGTGLGLAIAKRIVTAHNGTIKLDSFPGGTVFSIRIPAAVSPS
jgi:PAS domain S-box-containing protein